MSSGARTSKPVKNGLIISDWTWSLLCEPISVVTAPGLEDADEHVAIGDFLAEPLREPVHPELGQVVDAVAAPGDPAGDRADVDDVGDPAGAVLRGLQQ